MRNHDRHLSRREAERLLDDPTAASSALATTLATAGAPAMPGELRREDATVAAFHAARLTPSPTARTSVVSPRKIGRRAATRAVVATSAVVALTTGGFALANSAHLPTLPGQASDQATESVAKTPQPTASATSTTSTEATSESTETETTSESSAPTPSFEGLCRAYQATDHAAHGSSLDSAAFAALSAAAEADGADVATWCVALIGEPKETGKPSELPTPTSTPTGKPSVLPTPTGTPTAKPTQAPMAQPTQQPTGKASSASGKPTDPPSPTGKGGGRRP